MNKQKFLSGFHAPKTLTKQADYPLRVQGSPAAVLMPIVQRAELTMLFTTRASHLKHHAGQVSFPGGRYENNDVNLVETALRETEEEIGLSREKVDVIGQLQQYRTISRYEVTPFVGFVEENFQLSIDENEVDHCFEVPLQHLMQQENHLIHEVERKNHSFPIYFIPWQDKLIWGATAAFIRILSNQFHGNSY